MIYALVKVRESQRLLMIVNKVAGSLYFDSLALQIDALHIL